jgi:hypothetical protein
MLIEASAAPAGRSTDREREIRRHIGDYTLFFTGLFPDSVATLPRRRPFSADALVDYVKAGKESYAAVAAFDIGAYGRQVRLFRRLSDQFEQCVFALNAVKGDLDRLERGHYRRLQESLGLGD